MTTWTDVPDPRSDASPCTTTCEVRIEGFTWRHIADRHVGNKGEPWDEWLTPEVAARFAGLWSPGRTDAERIEILAAVAARFEAAIKESLRVPLGVLYDDYPLATGTGSTRGQETWCLVLPSGALLVVRSRPAGGEVRTCYYKRDACRGTEPRLRWRRTVRYILQTYASVQPDGTFRHPAATDSRREDADHEGGWLRARIRFRTQATWPLDGRPWPTMADPWGAAAPPPPKVALLPRRTD